MLTRAQRKTRDALLLALEAAPDDAQAALEFADWLEESGDAARAALARATPRAQPSALDRRFGVPDELAGYVRASVQHGFLKSLSIPAQWLVRRAKELAEEGPLLRSLTVYRVNGWGKRLARCAALKSVTDLELTAWVSPEDARAIAASPHLSRLRSLRIWLGNKGGDGEILAAFAEGARRAYPGLQELSVVDIPGCRAEKLQRIDQLAGRPVARAVIPEPRRYPIAACFGLQNAAGRLPDGTQVFIDVPWERDTRFRAFFFTAGGEQTEVRNLELPPPYRPSLEAKSEVDRIEAFRDQAQALLRDTLGFQPALIHVLRVDDPNDVYFVDDGVDYSDPRLGRPDDPRIPPEAEASEDNVLGNAAAFTYWLTHGAYIFGHGNYWWVGPDGRVEST